MRVFFDANLLFSAAKSDGAVRQFCRWLVDAGHERWADEYVVVEARRNLVGPEPQVVLDDLLVRMHAAAQPARPPSRTIDWLPVKDRPVLVAAIRLGCDVLVTGDRTHLGAGYGKTFGGVAIHSPRSIAHALMR